ncbi:methyltransferase domain-containing protein [Streptomyces sp. NPDC087850]|uniref:methyltransferase domain-containing protein n=1 Tax=Streptomyces sp. NPDC087850 TaxID=3365809 RepID=UPI0038203073
MTDDLTNRAVEARRALAQALTGTGDLTDPDWRRAFEEVPRHVFVPYFYAPSGERISANDPATQEQWFTAVHEDRSLVTHRTDGAATSSSSQPSLMATMLEALTVVDGLNVLEIGAGTGYNAALLAHRLGDDHVATVDIAEDITGPARERLATAGYRPTVITGDGCLLGFCGRQGPGQIPQLRIDRSFDPLVVGSSPTRSTTRPRPGRVFRAGAAFRAWVILYVS